MQVVITNNHKQSEETMLLMAQTDLYAILEDDGTFSVLKNSFSSTLGMNIPADVFNIVLNRVLTPA